MSWCIDNSCGTTYIVDTVTDTRLCRMTANAKQTAIVLMAESPELLRILKGAEQALAKALPYLPPDGEAVFCGEWLGEVKEIITKVEWGL